MNDTDFQQRAHANPWDDSPDFMDAVSQKPEYSALVATLQTQDKLLSEALSVPVPENLKTRLLVLPSRDQEQAAVYKESGTSTVVVPSVWQWQRWAPLAACLVLALVVMLNFLPGTTQKALASDVMAHIYREIGFLNSQSSVDRTELNEHLAAYGGQLVDSPAMNSLQAKGVLDCWIEKDQRTHFHMIMQGEKGTVTVIVMPGESVSSSFELDDERFDGIVVPTPKGNLVVAGEKGEPVEDLAAMLAGNIDW